MFSISSEIEVVNCGVKGLSWMTSRGKFSRGFEVSDVSYDDFREILQTSKTFEKQFVKIFFQTNKS